MLDQHKSQQNFQNLPQILMPKNFEEAYEIQQIFQKNSGRGKLGGFKIALASKVQQELCGIDHPIAGGIFANEIKNSPATFELDNFNGLGLEFELAVTLSDDLKPGMEPFDKNNIKQCYLANKYFMENQNKNLTVALYPKYIYNNNNNFKY